MNAGGAVHCFRQLLGKTNVLRIHLSCMNTESCENGGTKGGAMRCDRLIGQHLFINWGSQSYFMTTALRTAAVGAFSYVSTCLSETVMYTWYLVPIVFVGYYYRRNESRASHYLGTGLAVAKVASAVCDPGSMTSPGCWKHPSNTRDELRVVSS